jgi:hypothetical protein
MIGERWITIGTVRFGYQRIGNCGYPGGMDIDWRGRVDWCQPWQFVKWEELTSAVRKRLGFARLEVVAMACGIERGFRAGRQCEFLVLVRRRGKAQP